LNTDLMRETLVARAFRLECSTIAWMAVEFIVALYAGVVAHSLALIAFSLDSLIEIGHASVLMWRLRAELQRGSDFPEAVERRATQIGGWILAALALYITVSAVWQLWNRHGAEFSPAGLAVTLIAIPMMYFLSRAKYTLADRLGSHALRGDAAESASCLYLSATIVSRSWRSSSLVHGGSMAWQHCLLRSSSLAKLSKHFETIAEAPAWPAEALKFLSLRISYDAVRSITCVRNSRNSPFSRWRQVFRGRLFVR